MSKLFQLAFIGLVALFASQGFTLSEEDLSSFSGRYELIENENISDCAVEITVTREERSVSVKDIGELWGPKNLFFSDIHIKTKDSQVVESKTDILEVGMETGIRSQIRTSSVLSGTGNCLELKYSYKYQDPYITCREQTTLILDVGSGALSYQHEDCHTDRLPLGSKALWRWFVKQHHYPYEPQNFDNKCLYKKAGIENMSAKLKKCAIVTHNEYNSEK